MLVDGEFIATSYLLHKQDKMSSNDRTSLIDIPYLNALNMEKLSKHIVIKMNNFHNDLRMNYSEDFVRIANLDNVECVTLKPKPGKTNMAPFIAYCDKKGIQYYLVQEIAGVVHYHGLIAVPTWQAWKLFQQWFNKMYGFIKRSLKPINRTTGLIDTYGWFIYVHKQIVQEEGIEEEEIYVDEIEL